MDGSRHDRQSPDRTSPIFHGLEPERDLLRDEMPHSPPKIGSLVSATFHDRPTAVKRSQIGAIQLAVGNGAVQRLVTQTTVGAQQGTTMSRASDVKRSWKGSTIQRLVIYLPQGGKLNSPFLKADVPNFTEMVSLGYALRRAGGPIIRLDFDFSQVKDSERIFVVGHGSPGSSGGVKADELAKALTNDKTGLRKSARVMIVFTSCFAGAAGEKDPSMVHGLSERLKTHAPGSVVIGGEGPTIKGEALGTAFYVRQPGPQAKHFEDAKKEVSPISDKIQAAYKQWWSTNPNSSYEDRAKFAEELARKHNYQPELLKAILTRQGGGPKVVVNAAEPDEAKEAARAVRIEIDGQEVKEEEKAQYLQIALSSL